MTNAKTLAAEAKALTFKYAERFHDFQNHACHETEHDLKVFSNALDEALERLASQASAAVVAHPASQTSATASQPVGQGEPVAWRPKIGIARYQDFAVGRPAERIIAYWKLREIEIEYAYLAARHPQEATSEDTKRLDWLDTHHSAVSFAQGYLGRPASWGAFDIKTATWTMGFDSVRDAIDAARNPQQAAPTEGTAGEER